MIPAKIGCNVVAATVGNTYSGSSKVGIIILPISPSKLDPVITTITQNIAIKEPCLIVLSSFADKKRWTMWGCPGPPNPNKNNPKNTPYPTAPVAPPSEDSKIGSMVYNFWKKFAGPPNPKKTIYNG